MTENKQKRQVNKVGPTGRRVADNIKELRGGMQYKELSRRLSEVGRPIAPLGLRKIEEYERKVDVDDLTAFAVVFNVSPLRILMPSNGLAIDKSEVTGYPEPLPNSYIWSWVLGERPLNAENNSALALLLQRIDAIEDRDTPPDVKALHELNTMHFDGIDASKPTTDLLKEIKESE